MTLNEIALKLLKYKNVLIFSHSRPDGDTIGSSIALKMAFEKKSIKADIVCDYQEMPRGLEILKGVSEIKKPSEIYGDYDAVIAVDCSVPSVFGSSYAIFESYKNTFCIDHHISNSNYAKYSFVEESGACAEIIYKLICEMQVEIDAFIANSLLLGIVTDTGAFAHNNVSSNTLIIASKLLENGGNLHNIIKKTFKSQSKERAKLHAKVMSGLRYYLDGQVAVIITTKELLNECNATGVMTEGFIDFPLSIDGVEVAISLLEINDKKYKISFRSKGNVNVNEIASIYGGGGHVLASGAMLNGYLEDIIDKLVYNVKQRI